MIGLDASAANAHTNDESERMNWCERGHCVVFPAAKEQMGKKSETIDGTNKKNTHRSMDSTAISYN